MIKSIAAARESRRLATEVWRRDYALKTVATIRELLASGEDDQVIYDRITELFPDYDF